MYKVFGADADTYITDRVIKGERSFDANVGYAGTLDLFKLYGVTLSGSASNVELSRLLIHFDLSDITDLVSNGKLDPNHGSFKCKLKLHDVYGGQPNPINFTVDVHPLSQSFDEGYGKDIVHYGDIDVCNFLTASRTNNVWFLSGCASGGLPGLSVDYITASSTIANGTSLKVSQLFSTGEENLEVDVTRIVSATIAGLLPDSGFRISLATTHEDDNRTYFVKRFSSRHAYDSSKRPKLIVQFNDSIQDDTLNLRLGSTSSLFLFNYNNSDSLTNLLSASSQLTGSNCIALKLQTEISGGYATYSFTGSQHSIGINRQTGVYSASFSLSSTDSTLISKINSSGSIRFTPIWGSLDGNIAFLTGSKIFVYPPQVGSSIVGPKRVSISVIANETYEYDEEVTFRGTIFDHTSPSVRLSRLPIQNPGIALRNVHFQVREPHNNQIHIPFDTSNNSTLMSTDAKGVFFKVDMQSLPSNRSYVIDALIVSSDGQQLHKNVSPSFTVVENS